MNTSSQKMTLLEAFKRGETGINQDLLKEILDYDYETGIFKWKFSIANTVKAGDVAGSYMNGYRAISINSKHYRAHRLAWVYFYGDISSSICIDHINGNLSDNRISNLRQATHKENMHNQRIAQKNNTTGFLGVSYRKSTNKFLATIGLDGKKVFIGYFKTAELAYSAYLKKKREIHVYCTI